MKRAICSLSTVVAVLIVAMALTGDGFSRAAIAQTPSGPRVVSALGEARIQGRPVVVDVLVVVQPGEDARAAALAGLQSQGARPFSPATLGASGFTLTGLLWPSASVTQHYNPAGGPVAGEAQLTATHSTWGAVSASDFTFSYGGTVDRCPSLVRECPGQQAYDGNNDVGWAKLSRGILGVTWSGTNSNGTPEADMALSTAYAWNAGCVDVANSFDIQTVMLHENGHVLGLGHSSRDDSVMFASYQTARCDLSQDDEEGVTYLYDASTDGVLSGVVSGASGAVAGATVSLQGTSLETTTGADGSYEITGIPDPVTYTLTASKSGYNTSTINRKLVNGPTGADFVLTASSGDGGGPPVCVPKKFC